jgi:hypothetical protein
MFPMGVGLNHFTRDVDRVRTGGRLDADAARRA